MLSIILMAGTFTACTAEEKVNNRSLSPTVSTSVGVSVSGESSEMATTETTTNTEKPPFQKKQSLQDRIPKPNKMPTQPLTKAKMIDVQYAVGACIAYGQQQAKNRITTFLQPYYVTFFNINNKLIFLVILYIINSIFTTLHN